MKDTERSLRGYIKDGWGYPHADKKGERTETPSKIRYYADLHLPGLRGQAAIYNRTALTRKRGED